jgi:hypothetical protein
LYICVYKFISKYILHVMCVSVSVSVCERTVRIFSVWQCFGDFGSADPSDVILPGQGIDSHPITRLITALALRLYCLRLKLN